MSAVIEFNEEQHEYRVNGERWPSVTQVLDPLLELDGIPKDILEAAGRFGNHVHQACHLWDLGQLDEDALDPHLKPYLDGWKSFLHQTGALVINSELRVFNPLLKYAGTLDKLILWRERRHVLDIKTSAEVPYTVGPQCAAYREAYLKTDSGVTCSTVRYCVHLRPDASYRLHPLNDPGDFHMFVSALNVHNFRSRNGRRR